MINFDALPKDKPNNNTVTEGRYTATVFSAKMVPSKKTPGEEYLNVSFKIDNGGFVNENYFDSDRPFLQYKLGQLLKACKVTLAGEGSLKDVSKVVVNKKVIIDVVVNDRGYGAIDYSGNNEGLYPVENTTTTTTLDADLGEAVDTNILDEDF